LQIACIGLGLHIDFPL
ncbi:hypothetical protein VCHC50A2_3347B, partial [Vibrio cholerae HC-50A2]